MTTLIFSSSSSEDEDEYYKDVQLRRDIHQLERALNNVDTKSDLRQVSAQYLILIIIISSSCHVS